MYNLGDKKAAANDQVPLLSKFNSRLIIRVPSNNIHLLMSSPPDHGAGPSRRKPGTSKINAPHVLTYSSCTTLQVDRESRGGHDIASLEQEVRTETTGSVLAMIHLVMLVPHLAVLLHSSPGHF
jgi:hypothetical protein